LPDDSARTAGKVGGDIVTVRDELQARALFQERYGNRPSPTACQIEQRVIGGDWGANGYTTMAQADELARGLGLSAGDRLLDLGTGRGWPGLYLAARTGCRVVLTDLPLEGLRVAANRAAGEGLAARAGVVASAASGLPFRAGSFDAVIHTDVLC
jgi:SAM-dependent methyltransferase